MKGKHHVVIESPHLKYEFDIKRNITVILGDSATGKTTLIDLINEVQRHGNANRISIVSDVKCRVYSGDENEWKLIFTNAENTVFFIDEGYSFIFSKEFAEVISGTDNYYVLITRRPLPCLPYSVNEIYGIRTSGKYHFPQQVYHEFYPIYDSLRENFNAGPAFLITEDSKSGFQFVKACCGERIKCVSAEGNAGIFKLLVSAANETRTAVLADGAAFGAFVSKVLAYAETLDNIMLYLPESFEWLVLRSGVVTNGNLDKILEHPEDYIDSRMYFSWERFFNDYLEKITADDDIRKYRKQMLEQYYLEGKNRERIIDVFPEQIQKLLRKT